MSQAEIQNADKNIVKRRRIGNVARKVLNRNRSPVNHSKINPENFAAEMLLKHAEVQRNYGLTFLLAILGGAVLAWQLLPLKTVLIWVFVAWTMVVIRNVTAGKYCGLENKLASKFPWKASFYLSDIMFGAVWASLIALILRGTDDALINSISFASAMVIMGLGLLTAHNLRFGPLVASIPLITTVILHLGMDQNLVSLGMAGVLIFIGLFFDYLGSLIRNSRVAHLHSEIVRDQLIVELESARSISDEARRRAEEANLAKSRFLATMSHELRTPLNAILGFSEVMSKEIMGPLDNDYYKEYVRDIHSSGSHLLHLINEILDLSRVEAGRQKIDEEPVNLAHAAEEAQQMMKLKANDKNITVALQLQPDLPQISADDRGVRQIILNLLSNALKFTPDGGNIWIKVGWTAGGGQYISIKDSGPGIPEDEIPVVLSSFGQGSIAIKSAEQGTGLGLPIVQALVHLHDGHFELKSKLREGTEVIATFPRKRVLPRVEKPQNEVAQRVDVTPPAMEMVETA